MQKIVEVLNNIIWSPALIVLLVGAGLYFSIRTRFVQIRRIGHMASLLFKGTEMDTKASESNKVSSFQAFCMTLSACVGTGNIVGVATAIAFGGPGAVFWMWMIAFLGAATSFVECTMAQLYKFPHKGGWRGGPTTYIERGLGQKWLAVIFAVLLIIGYGMTMIMVQSNGVCTAFDNLFHFNPLIPGLILAFLLGLVIIGGVRRIAKVATVVTPLMAVVYVLMALVVVSVNWRNVPGAFEAIFRGAFGINPVCGGILGSTIAMGVKRGLFSNEAGEGGPAIVSASADVPMPAQQGLLQAFSVYIDTIVICTMTALMILCTGMYNIFDYSTTQMIFPVAAELGNNYVGFTQAAVDSVFVGYGSYIVAIALAFFVFTTMMSYYFIAESCIVYLFHTKTSDSGKLEKFAILLYRLVFLALSVLAAVMEANQVWKIGDIGLGLTTWVNVLALLILCPQAVKALKTYESNLK